MKPETLLRLRILATSAALVFLCSACSPDSAPPRAERISALALKASPAAYAMFEKQLEKVKPVNDFTTRAKDPANYDVYISETDDDFLFSFSMRPLKGERILDNRSVYAVNKKNGLASVRSVL